MSGIENKMGHSWMHRFFGTKGYDLMIDEPLTNGSGDELKVDFDAAEQACMALNPPDQQDTVKAIFKNREAQLKTIRGEDVRAILKREVLKRFIVK